MRHLAIFAILGLVLAACGDDGGGDATTTTEAPAEVTTTEAPAEATTTEAPAEATTTMGDMPEAIKACQVTDTGGIDDQSFNQTAFKGIEDAIAAGYASEDSTFLESQADTDYVPNIQSFIDAGCDLIVTVGFLLTEATGQMADENPDQLFQIID